MFTTLDAAPSGLSDARHARWGHLSPLHGVIIVLSVIITVGAWQFSRHQIDARIESRFDATRDSTIGLIKARMQKYEDALWSGVSAMRSHENDMTLEEWREFSKTLRIDQKYPGINGIGVIHFVTPNFMPSYLAQRQRERSGFSIKPMHEHPLKMPISFIEPENVNAAAVGLDVAHEVNRRTAALASRDTGTAQITGPITLVQDAGHTPGFLFYTPYYSTDINNADLAQRKDTALGLVYAPFVVRKLMQGLLAKDRRSIRFSITDAGENIYDEHTDDDDLNDPNPMFSERVVIELYGREWVLDMRTNLAFREANTYGEPTLILIAGLIIEVLIVGMIIMMARANTRTLAYADRVTEELQEEKHKLALSNKELEQFAYVASHDLKTPIRGIGGLTEMLREDLEDYFATPDAMPEVGQNLERIEARVARMNELTRGIMEFSRVGSIDTIGEPLHLNEVVQAMITDFGLAKDQIELCTDVPVLNVDTGNLRRVLENLVGNAVKYHDGKNPLKIVISLTRVPERVRIEVADNGPGIEQQFHQRVFEVFQTLRAPDDPESTGIGLAIVKKLVERQAGAITLTSEPGQGARFSFDWPVKIDGTHQRNGAGSNLGRVA